ncbi:MAG TPA: MBL fold metallo-hydrolase [Solirubrobacteraceae bacterium]|nr:MBL fold metallo-hydrolase [Solirubrobacteraceae bacterium]
MQVDFCGVRGSLPAVGAEFARYGGHTSCVALTRDGESAPSLILDAGTGVQLAAELLGGEPFDGTILLSHLHWDHVQGLPFFAGGDRTQARVDVLLPEQESGASALEILSGMMSPPYFPIDPTELRGQWSFATVAPGVVDVDGFEVLAREIPHRGGRTFGYRVSDGNSSIAYLPDHHPTALGPGEDGFGEYHTAALELADGVDVLVHDAQLLPDELASEGHFGHAVADYSVALAERAGAKSVALFHHRLDRTDDELDALALRLGRRSAAVSVASERVALRL